MNQPTNCKEVRPSVYHLGEISEEPCHDENEEYLKYKEVEKAYCFPHITEHPNMLEAITECKRNPRCRMFFQDSRNPDDRGILSQKLEHYINSYFLCSKGARVNLKAGRPTTLYVLKEDVSEVLKQTTIVPDVTLKSSNENNITTKKRGTYVSFVTFVVLLIILMFRAVIRAIRKLSTYLNSLPIRC